MAKQAVPKIVQVIARYEFKQSGHIVYQVRSSNGLNTYCTTVIDGKSTGCSCPAHKPCKHMRVCEQVEQQRTIRRVAIMPIEARYIAPLNGNRAFSLLR